MDANVLFSAAYKPRSRLVDLWKLDDAEIITSGLALEEARRNLEPDEAALSRLIVLAARTRVVPEVGQREPGLSRADQAALDALPDKDRPILAAAIAARAAMLVTGDLRHFGALMGRVVAGVKVIRPVEAMESL